MHARLAHLRLQATRATARLLRDQRALTGAGDGFSATFTRVVNEVATDLGPAP